MPVDDQRLERALRDAAPPVEGADAFERVAAKRARRRTVRAARLSGIAALGAVVVVASVVLVTRDEDRTRVDSAPVAGTPGVAPVSLAGEAGYLRGPLTVSGDLVSVAAYEQPAADGGFDFPPSRIVRFDPETLAVIDRVDLKAEILSVADGADGVRWAITRNKDPEGPVLAGTFLKRIAADGTVTSTDLPPGTVIGGPVTVTPTSVLVPTGTDALAFDLDGHRRPGDGQLATLTFGSSPRGFVRDPMRAVQVHGPRMLVEGTYRGVRGAVLAEDGRVVDTISLPGRDVAFAWVDDDTVLATTDGRLVRIDVRP
jgi:hypothetical protein